MTKRKSQTNRKSKRNTMTKRKRSKKELAAIRRYYAEKCGKTSSPTVDVQIKNYRDKNGGHPHVLVDDIDNNFVSVGFTHSPKKGKGHPNYKLEVNPLGEQKQAYMRRQGTVAPKRDYIEPRTGKMTEADYTKAKEFGDRAKQKYIENKNKKK
jgi:hypothetical protein